MLTRWLINLLNYPDKLSLALERSKKHNEGIWDKIRLEIAKGM